MHLAILAWTLLLAANGALGDGFLFPTSQHSLSIRGGDSMTVSWKTSLEISTLYLYCDDSSDALATHPAGRDESVTLHLDHGEHSSCYFELRQQDGAFYSSYFPILPSNGAPRLWNKASVAERRTDDSMRRRYLPADEHLLSPSKQRLQQSPSASISGFIVSVISSGGPSALPTVSGEFADSLYPATFPNHNNATFPGMQRPAISLPSDGPDDDYIFGTLDCLDLKNTIQAECWTLLNINEWLPEWYRVTPRCPPGSTEDALCIKVSPAELWTTAFLRIGGSPNQDCSEIGTGCQYGEPPEIGEYDSRLSNARYFYVRYNIQILWQFFSKWESSMDDAMDQAGAIIQGVIDLIDKPRKTRVGLQAVLSVLGFGFSFLSDVDLGLGEIGDAATEIITSAIEKTPEVAGLIWPSGTADTSTVQIDLLTGQLQNPGGIRTELETSLATSLKLVQGENQSDVSAFINFAGGGDFSKPFDQVPHVDYADGSALVLLQAFNTYLVSEALRQNGWKALMVPGANPVDLYTGTVPCPPWSTPPLLNTKKGICHNDNVKTKDMGCHSYDSNFQCNENYWWYSEPLNSAYALIHDDDKPGQDGMNLLQNIFKANWSIGSLLFEDASICELQYLLELSARNVEYTVSDGVAGFIYEGPKPTVFLGAQDLNDTTSFLSIQGNEQGNAFVAASTSDVSFGAMKHPPNIFRFDGQGLDTRCTSQLDTVVANSWGGRKAGWTGNNP